MGLLRLWEELRNLLAGQMTEMQAAGALPDRVEPLGMASLFHRRRQWPGDQVTLDPSGPDLGAMAGQFGPLLLAARRESHGPAYAGVIARQRRPRGGR